VLQKIKEILETIAVSRISMVAAAGLEPATSGL
jgi:hypothetical protein